MQRKPIEYLTASIPMTRISPKLKTKLLQELRQSHHQSLAALIREKLETTRVTAYQQQRVATLQELGAFRNELQRIGTNVNQVARMVNTFKNGKLLSEELALLINLQKELSKINAFLDEIEL